MVSSLQIILQTFVISCIYRTVICTDSAAFDDLIELSTESLSKTQQGILKAGAGNPEVLRAFQLQRTLPVNKFTIVREPEIDFLQNSTSYPQENVTQCNVDLIYTLASLNKPWAEQMMDAFAKPPSGILRGQAIWPGSYDECLKIKAPASDLSPGFYGRHAWITLMFANNVTNTSLSVRVGACLPSTCAEDQSIFQDYNHFVRLLSKLSYLRKFLSALPEIAITFVPVDYPLDSASVACIVICSLFVALAACGTLVDVVRRYKEKAVAKHSNKLPDESSVDSEVLIAPDQSTSAINSITADTSEILVVNSRDVKSLFGDFLLCFSVITNTESILDTSSGQGHLQCVHGIRFLSMAWVILGHTYYFTVGSIGNVLDLIELAATWPIQVILQGTYSVDTFFLLSGCLMSYIFFKHKHQFTGVKPWVMFYVHRYVRLTPVYAMLMFVLATWWNCVGNGPFWNTFYKDTCAKTWWWNIIYINNFLDSLKMCMGWAWYLANDMQFYVISPIFLIAFKRSKIAGCTIVLALLVASWIATGVISHQHDLHVIFGNNASDVATLQETQQDMFSLVYVKPYTRIGPYLIGVLLGLALYEVRGNQKFLHKSVVLVGWLASQVMSLTLLYGLQNADLGPITSSAHLTLARTTWAMTVAWVIFACITGHAGPVNILLSWKVWIPLSRLTYCAYLVHPMVMMWYTSTLRTTMYFSNSQIVSLFLSFLVLSYGLAFIASILFEAPIMKLEKFLKKL